MFDFKKLKKYNGRKAVSPVVATLILIIVAIVGAVAVGLIVSGIGNQTAKGANGGAAASNSQTQLFVGGSTTIYPLELASQPAFEAQTGINLVLAQGGSDAGMQGVLTGALDIGTASSVKSVNALENVVVSESLANVVVNPVLIGGSGVVVGTSSLCTAAVAGAVPIACGALAAAPGAGPLYDGTNACVEITRDALAKIYSLGTFYIGTGACGAPAGGAAAGTLIAACITATNVGPLAATCATAALAGIGPFVALARSDPGGTTDAFGSYITGDQTISYSSGAGEVGAAIQVSGGAAIIGNLGNLQATQACAQKPGGVQALGCISYFDLGFGEGANAAAGATCPGQNGATPCKISIAELSSAADPAFVNIGVATNYDAIQNQPASSATSQNQYVFNGQSTSSLHNFIKTALKSAVAVNPLTLAGATSVYPDVTAPVNSLCRTFYLVTNGSPNANEQKYITFLSSPNAEPFFVAQGYFTQYDLTSA